MRSLLDLIVRYYHWLLFIVLEGVSLTLLFRFNHYQSSVWLTTANTIVGTMDSWEQQALRYVNLGVENEELMRRNLILEYNLAQLQQRLTELTHDSTYTELRQAERYDSLRLIPAHITTNSVLHRNNFITIDRGEVDGVRPEMGVVCGTGIVGIVFKTSAHYALVISLLNRHSHISCRLRGTGYFGELKWDGRHPLYAVLDDIPRHARFRVGDIVETSGSSEVFPSGIFVGKVSAIENSDDGLSYKLRVHLGTDFSRLQNVTVVAQKFLPEVRSLEEHADSLNTNN